MTLSGWRCAALLALLGACTPSFQSQSQVVDLRVLAIRAEPAEAHVDLQANSVEPVVVRALVADPLPREALVVHGRVCFPTDSGRCDGSPDIDPRAVPSKAMEQQPLFALAVPADVIAAALQDDRLKGFGGVRVQFALDAADGDPNGVVRASKLLVYSTSPTPNGNPEITALQITQDGAALATAHPGETVSLPAGAEVGLRPVLGERSAGIEEYDTLDLSGKTIHLREAPRYSFFATPPLDLDRDDADEPLPGASQPTNGIARLTVNGAGMLWVVVRDGRGGTGWISVCVAVNSPGCQR